MAKKKEDSKANESKEEIKDKEDKIENEEDIVEEEKEEEAATKEQDYNSIFDDDYVEDDDKKESKKETDEEKGSESEKEVEEAGGEKKEEGSEEEPESEEEDNPDEEIDEEEALGPEDKIALDKPGKKKESKKISKKKILIALAVFLALLLGAFGGYLYFKGTNKPKEEPAPAKTEEPQKEETKKEVYVTADGGLNMRENPDKNAKVLILIPNGTKLTVLEEQGDWYKVEYNGQTGWVMKDYVSETKPDDMKAYTGTGFSADNPKFSIKYPSDWTLNGYKVSKADAGKTYTVAFGEGGHGFAEDENSGVVSTQEDITVNGIAGKKTTAKKDGKIVVLVSQFLKGDSYINIEFSPPEGYDDSYVEIYNKIVNTFKFL